MELGEGWDMEGFFLHMRKRGRGGIWCRGGPCKVLLRFIPIVSLASLNPEGIKDRERRRVKFRMERLIINSAGALSFRQNFVSFPLLTHNSTLLILTQGTSSLTFSKKKQVKIKVKFREKALRVSLARAVLCSHANGDF